MGRVQFSYCPTKEMVADALTKLATANVIQILIDAMDGRLPTRTITHRTSVSPGRANRSDEAGDGPKVGSNKYLTMQNILVICIIVPELVAISLYNYVYIYSAQAVLSFCLYNVPSTMQVGGKRETCVRCIHGKPPAPPEWWLAWANEESGYFNLTCLLCDKQVHNEGLHKPGRWASVQHKKWQVWYDDKPDSLFVIEARTRIERKKARLHPVGPPPVGKWKMYFDKRSQTPFWHQESSNQSLWELPQDAEVELSDEDEEGLPNTQELLRWVGSDYYGQLEVGKTASMVEIKT